MTNTPESDTMKTLKLDHYTWLVATRPKWWFINPWLYIKRRDKAYASALETIEELSKEQP